MQWSRKKIALPHGLELVAVGVIADVWMSAIKPSKDPKRRDVLQISVCTKKINYMEMLEYRRVNGKIQFLQESDFSGPTGSLELVGGWMSKPYPPSEK